ncbi:C-type lectin 2-like [Glandiceps talaboti]
MQSKCLTYFCLFQSILLTIGFIQVEEEKVGVRAPCVFNEFDGYCYRFVGDADDELKTWTDAAEFCRNDEENRGGTLTSILSPTEQYFVSSLTNADITWIGLHDLNTVESFLLRP